MLAALIFFSSLRHFDLIASSLQQHCYLSPGATGTSRLRRTYLDPRGCAEQPVNFDLI